MMLKSQNPPPNFLRIPLDTTLWVLKKIQTRQVAILFLMVDRGTTDPKDDQALPEERGLKFIRILIRKHLRHIN